MQTCLPKKEQVGKSGVAQLVMVPRYRHVITIVIAVAIVAPRVWSAWDAGRPIAPRAPSPRMGAEAVRLTAPLFSAIAAAGQVGADASAEEQAAVIACAEELAGHGAPQPARAPLVGRWDLLYSDSTKVNIPGLTGAGKVGPNARCEGPPWTVGEVCQLFFDESKYVNQVAFGFVATRLYATRTVIDRLRIRVSFTHASFSFFGLELPSFPAEGGGVWEHVYVDSESSPTLRVMKTPSLFVLQKVEDD